MHFKATSTHVKQRAITAASKGRGVVYIEPNVVLSGHALVGEMRAYDSRGDVTVYIALYLWPWRVINHLIVMLCGMLRLKPVVLGPSISCKWKYSAVPTSNEAMASFIDFGGAHSIVPGAMEGSYAVRSTDIWGESSQEGEVLTDDAPDNELIFGAMALASVDLLNFLFLKDNSLFALYEAMGLKPILKITEQIKAVGVVTTNPSTGYGIGVTLQSSGNKWVVSHTDSSLPLGYIFAPKWISVKDKQISLSYSTYKRNSLWYRLLRKTHSFLRSILWRVERIRLAPQEGVCQIDEKTSMKEHPLLSTEWEGDTLKITARIFQNNERLYTPVGEVHVQRKLSSSESFLLEKVAVTMYRLILKLEQ